MSALLHILYQQVSDITNPLCMSGDGCGPLAEKPYHCCEKQYCDMAARYAKKYYDINLQPTGHEITFMGEQGCTVPLHLRPVCTLHVCSITWAGTSTIQNDSEKTRKFLELRKEIFRLESKAGRDIEPSAY